MDEDLKNADDQSDDCIIDQMIARISDQIDVELEKGYEDVLAGRTKPAREVFVEIRKAYKL